MNFRSYAAAKLKPGRAPVVLAGPNGTGKTNCLEAISLLSPGRGLRGAKLASLQRKVPLATAPERDGPLAQSPWTIAATIARPDGDWEIGTGLANTSAGTQRRALHLNGAPAHAADLAELLPVLWLTPAMDRLFLEGASERRRFLDRLVFGLDAAHARRATRYERAMHERLRLLRDGVRDPRMARRARGDDGDGRRRRHDRTACDDREAQQRAVGARRRGRVSLRASGAQRRRGRRGCRCDRCCKPRWLLRVDAMRSRAAPVWGRISPISKSGTRRSARTRGTARPANRRRC